MARADPAEQDSNAIGRLPQFPAPTCLGRCGSRSHAQNRYSWDAAAGREVLPLGPDGELVMADDAPLPRYRCSASS
jgi:hypothetical protein